MKGEEQRPGVQVSQLLRMKSMSPSLAKRIQQKDSNGDGVISLEEAVNAFLCEDEVQGEVKMLRLLSFGLLFMTVVVLACTGGAIYALVKLDMQVTSQNGYMISRSSEIPLSLARAKESVPLNVFSDTLGQWVTGMDQMLLQSRDNSFLLTVGTVRVNPSNQTITIEATNGVTVQVDSDGFGLTSNPESSLTIPTDDIGRSLYGISTRYNDSMPLYMA